MEVVATDPAVAQSDVPGVRCTGLPSRTRVKLNTTKLTLRSCRVRKSVSCHHSKCSVLSSDRYVTPLAAKVSGYIAEVAVGVVAVGVLDVKVVVVLTGME